MSEPTVDVIAKIDEIARMAGIKGRRDGNMLRYGFDLDNGRDQIVMVTEFHDTAPNGMHIVVFLSPCQEVGTGLLSGMSKKTALQVLRTNMSLPFGHFCLLPIDKKEYLCVRATQLLETMEIDEFRAHCLATVQIADAWEARLGKDAF